MRILHVQREVHPFLGQNPSSFPDPPAPVELHHQRVVTHGGHQSAAAVLQAIGMAVPQQMRRINADHVKDAGLQKVHQSQPGALPHTRAHRRTGDAVVHVRSAGLVDDIHLKERLQPACVRHAGLGLHAGAHAGYVPHLKPIPPGSARGMSGVFREDVDQLFIQADQTFLHGRAQRDAGHGLGQRLAPVGLSRAVWRPVALKPGDSLAHDQQRVSFRIQCLKPPEEAIGIFKRNANRSGKRPLDFRHHSALKAAS